MKRFLSIGVMLSLMVAFSSCSSKPDDLPVSQNASATKSTSIIAAAGNTTSSEITFKLSDFSTLSKYVEWVESGLVQTTSVISVSGITSGQVVELTNVKLSLKSNSKTSLDLPTITANASFKELPQLNFLQKVLDEVVNKGISTVVLSYKATNDITTSVTFSMKIDGKFSF
ncbi:MAG: hypothetical protein PHW81_08920 [Petrimonas sp.]|nr:hypothetical protein [Petrimonas sp.]